MSNSDDELSQWARSAVTKAYTLQNKDEPPQNKTFAVDDESDFYRLLSKIKACRDKLEPKFGALELERNGSPQQWRLGRLHMDMYIKSTREPHGLDFDDTLPKS